MKTVNQYLKNKTKYDKELEEESKKKPKIRTVREVAEENGIDLGVLTSEKSSKGFFKDSKAFDDGYHFGDITKTVVSTGADLMTDIGEGFIGASEGIADWGQYRVADALNLFGAKKASEAVKKNAQFDSTAAIFGKNEKKEDNFAKDWTKGIEENSISGDTLDTVMQGVGQVGAMAGASYLGGGGAEVGAGATKLQKAGQLGRTAFVSYTSAYGNARSEAYKNGADDSTANKAGMINGFSEAIAEQFFNGLPGYKSAGWFSKVNGKIGGKIEKVLGTKIGRTFLKLSDTFGEGAEEMISNALNSLGTDIAHYIGTKTGKEYNYGMENLSGNALKDMVNSFTSEDSIESFFSAALTSALIGGGNTFLSNSQKNTILKEYAKENNITVQQAEKQLNATIESQMPNLPFEEKVEEQERLQKQELNNMKNGTFVAQETDTETPNLPINKKNQRFNYDSSKITDEFEKAVYESAKKNLNNEEQTHKFVEKVAQIAKDKQTNYGFINNEELKTSGYNIEGKEIGGLVATNEDGQKQILINIDSPKALNSIVGHETTHLLEGTKEYQELQQSIFEYAKQKGDFEGRQKTLTELYENVENADINSEITADLVGDYLFTDEKFINSLSANKPSLFQKIKDLIDDLIVRFKGTKEEKLLREVQKKFKAAYKQDGNLENSKYMMIGKNGVKTGMQTNSRYNNLKDRYFEAVRMENKKASNEQIRQQTGWFKDNQGNWEFEISDENTKFKEKPQEKKKYKISEIFEAQTLFELYPDLKSINVEFKKIGGLGNYSDSSKTININKKLISDLESARGTLLHEIQHFIQRQEGFPTGTTIKFGNAHYVERKGEVEAADTKRRMNYTVEKRKSLIPESAKDEPMHPNRRGLLRHQRNLVEKITEKLYNKYGDKFDDIDQETFLEDIRETSESLVKAYIEDSRVNEELDDSSFNLSLSEQLEKQGTKILEESELKRQGMIDNFKEYLEEHNITHPTQKDIDDSITDILGYDNEQSAADNARDEKLYNQYVREYMEDNNISFEEQIQGLENYTRDEIKDITKDYINQILEDNGIYDVNIVDMDIHGSRNRGTAKNDSDLDIVIQYDGDIREDDLFNVLNDNGDENLYIDDIKVDINPIQENIKDYMERSKEYDKKILNSNNIKYSLNGDKDLSYQTTQYDKAWGKNITADSFMGKNIKLYDNLKEQTEAIEQLNRVKGNPDSEITIYRATPSDSINTGDWVFLDRKQAEKLTRSMFSNTPKPGYKVVAEKVKAKDVDWTGKNLEFVYSPNGERSVKYSLTQDNQGRKLSEQQQEFFKDSKARDDNGNLISLYHGTRNDFTVFDITKSGESSKQAKVGFWFTESKEGAENFGNSVWYGKNDKAKAMEVYLNLKNPKIYDVIDNTAKIEQLENERNENKTKINKIKDKYGISSLYTSYDGEIFMRYAGIYGSKYSNYTDEEIINMIKNDFNLDKEVRNNPKEYLEEIKQYDEYKKKEDKYYRESSALRYTDPYEQFRSDIYKLVGMDAYDANVGGTGMAIDNENEVMQKYVSQLKEEGYDGILIKNTDYDTNTLGSKNNQYVAFYPNQIKNVDNTNPTIDDDIRYSLPTEDSKQYGNYNVYGEDVKYQEPTETNLPSVQSGVLTDKDYKDKENELLNKFTNKISDKVIKQTEEIAKRNLELKKKDTAELKSLIDNYKNMTKEEIYKSDAKTKINEFVRNHASQEFQEEVFDDELSSLQKEIKNTKFIIDEKYKSEFPDGITAFKKLNPGLNIVFGKNSNIDSRYQELAENYKGRLSEDATAGDIPYILADILNEDSKQMKTMTYELNNDDIEQISNKIYFGLTNNSISKQNLEKYVSNIQDKIQNKYARQMAIQKYRDLAREQIGDITEIKDKKRGLSYQTNTMKRNLRDIMSPEQAKRMYDTYFKTISENNAKIEIDKQSYVDRIQKLNLTDEESVYTQMLGEKKYNPKTTITQEQLTNYLDKHYNKIDTTKVDAAIEEFRNIYDELIVRVNDTLKANGYKPIDYRKGYFPHFIEDKPTSLLGKFAEKLGWKVNKGTLPTDIAGITEEFKPGKAWTSFSQKRTGDATDYNAMKGLDNYLNGAMDVIHHTEDIQKLRALESEIRYQYSDKGVQEKIDEIFEDQDLSAEEKYEQIALFTDHMKNNGLGNFATELRNYTNNLANKKSFHDRSMEQTLGRDTYSIMNNISSRVSANMVGANISSALTNFIPITQAWSQISTKNLMKGMAESIKASIKDDGFANNSVYLTNRTKQADKLYKTTIDKINDKLGIPFEAVDSFTSNTIVRAKYLDNIEKGMSEQAAMENADEFAKDVMAGRSKGDNPTIFNQKNPVAKLFTAFQLEVNNQFGYMFKDIKADLAGEAKDKLAAAFLKMFLGAWIYNYFSEKITGRKSAFSPIDMAIDDIKTATNENMDLGDKISTIATNKAKELPFVGGVMGGGRLPIQGAIPYENPLSMITSTISDVSDLFDEEKKDTAIRNLTKEWQKPLYYLGMPFGGGQIKKTIEGLSMYDENLPIAGSYTNAGKLRFEADDSTLGKLQAAVFGQYASKNAREYFENGYSPLSEKQINEALDANLPIDEYREINKGIKEAKAAAKENEESQSEAEYDYIYNLPISMEQKNSLLNSKLGTGDEITDKNGYVKYKDKNDNIYWVDEESGTIYNNKYRESNINKDSLTKYSNKKDLTNYGDYGSLEEFNYANNNPSKYSVVKQITDYNSFKNYKDDIASIKQEYNDGTTRGSKIAKQQVYQYINSLNLNKYQKLMLEKMAGGYSIKDYKSEMREYIESLSLTKEEKQTIDKELFG